MTSSADPTELTAELITAATRVWPELAHGALTVPRQGMDHRVVVLGERVLRAPVTEAYRRQAPTEAAVLSEIASLTQVRLPVVLRHTNDWSLTVHPFLSGTPLDAGHWARLSPGQRDRVVDQLASLLTALHSRDVTTPPYRDVEPWFRGTTPNPAPRALPAKVALLGERVGELDLDHEDRRVIGEIFEGMKELLDPSRPPRLVHGDLYSAHLLWSDDRGLGAIDFSDMNLGDPAVDFAHLSDISPTLPAEVLARTPVDHGPGVLDRAWAYKRWDAVFLLADHLRTGHTDAATAWSLFDAARHPVRPGAR